jgi:phosphoglycolate phosphatase/pyrophosphatase PpaX
MEKYHLSPGDLLVVDDMKPAYEMAGKVGVPIAFAAWGRKEYPDICAEMERLCDFTFFTTEDLEKFLFD